MSLSPTEIGIMRELSEGGKALQLLRSELGLSPQQISRPLKSLTKRGLVSVRKNGLSKTVLLSDVKSAQMLRNIVISHGHMNLEKILSLSSLEILGALEFSQGGTLAEIASLSQKSPRTLATVFRQLSEVGILEANPPGTYRISTVFSSFGEFAMELTEGSVRKEVVQLYPDALIRWQKGRTVLIESGIGEERGEFRSTSFSAFHRFASPPILVKHWYINLRGKKMPTIEEIAVHTLLLSPLDARQSKLLREFLRSVSKKMSVANLSGIAEEYGVSHEISGIAEDIAWGRKTTRKKQ
jgi:DNA-binding transcriptional ArsR family regulator